MSEKVTLPEALENAFLTLIAGIHTCLPGRIETYDFNTQKATIKPLIKKQFIDGTIIKIPILTNVPVVFPRTKLSGITFPLTRGDGVLVVFAERSLERWYSSGDDVEPGDTRKFDLSDAIAVPGLYSFADSNIASNNDDLEIHHRGQTVTIKKNGDIEVGSASLLKLVTSAFQSLYNAHTHTGVTTGGGISGVPSSPMGSSHLTSKVRAQ